MRVYDRIRVPWIEFSFLLKYLAKPPNFFIVTAGIPTSTAKQLQSYSIGLAALNPFATLQSAKKARFLSFVFP
jgi:hypothetical protein